MRVYVPSTLTALAVLHETGRLAPDPTAACAVTPALREWYSEGDQEELEYAAMTAAARGSLRLLASDEAAPRRRVVLAVEVPDRDVTVVGDGRADVLVTVPVPLRWVAAVHVDDEASEAEVSVAVRALPAVDAGDEDAQFAVDAAEDHELAWYATQEVPRILSGGRSES